MEKMSLGNPMSLCPTTSNSCKTKWIRTIREWCRLVPRHSSEATCYRIRWRISQIICPVFLNRSILISCRMVLVHKILIKTSRMPKDLRDFKASQLTKDWNWHYKILEIIILVTRFWQQTNYYKPDNKIWHMKLFKVCLLKIYLHLNWRIISLIKHTRKVAKTIRTWTKWPMCRRRAKHRRSSKALVQILIIPSKATFTLKILRKHKIHRILLEANINEDNQDRCPDRVRMEWWLSLLFSSRIQMGKASKMTLPKCNTLKVTWSKSWRIRRTTIFPLVLINMTRTKVLLICKRRPMLRRRNITLWEPRASTMRVQVFSAEAASISTSINETALNSLTSLTN